MHNTQVTVHDESLGKDFTVVINSESVIINLQSLIDAHKTGQDDEYPAVGNVDSYGHEITKEERDKDLLEIQDAITFFSNEDMQALAAKVVEEQPRKKNGSFSKGRVNNLYQFDSFGRYWEDHYGTNTPAIRSRAIDDYKVEVSYEEYIVKY